MSNSNELDALKQQLDNLLEDRQAVLDETVETKAIERPQSLPQRPAPKPEPVKAEVSSQSPVEAEKVTGEDTLFVRQALDQIGGSFILYAADFSIIFANKMARSLWPHLIEGLESGLSVLDATANEIRALLPDMPEDQILAAAQEKVAMYGNPEPLEVFATEGRCFRLNHHKVAGDLVCSMGFDITVLKRREKQLEEARVEAVEANVAKSEFLARMSHEIKTPLNAIVGMSDALMEDTKDPDVLETMEYIVTAAEGLSHVLGQTLDHAKLMSEKVVVELQHHSMRETVQKVAGMWKKACDKKNVKLNIHVHKNVPETVVFDRFRLQQCLNNLLSNAIKFTDAGHITVAAKLIEKAEKPSVVAIVVQDSGVGMTEDASKRIFNAFEQADQTTTRLFGGTGLGLSITKQLVEAMQGTITVQSDLGKGTAFLLTLPADLDVSEDPIDTIKHNLSNQPDETPKESQNTLNSTTELASEDDDTENVESEPAAAKTEEEIGKSPFEGLSVLCVEDNPVNHVVIKKLIGQQVKSVAFANNGEEGLKALSTQDFDVVLMDIHMPVMDGIETTLKIRGSNKPWADVIIIAVTADPDFQYQRVCRNIGMNDAIGKPVKRQDILDSIARSLDVLKETHAQRVELPIAM